MGFLLPRTLWFGILQCSMETRNMMSVKIVTVIIKTP